jgi:hypothetical protein
MLLDKLQRNPEKSVPLGVALLTVGLAILMIGINWPRIPAHLPADWNDFARGFLYGLAITLEAASIVVLAKAARRKRRQ